MREAGYRLELTEGGEWISIHRAATVHPQQSAQQVPGIQTTHLPSRNSQSASTPTCQPAIPTVEMASRARRRELVLQLSAWTQDSEIFQGLLRPCCGASTQTCFCAQTLGSSQRCLAGPSCCGGFRKRRGMARLVS